MEFSKENTTFGTYQSVANDIMKLHVIFFLLYEKTELKMIDVRDQLRTNMNIKEY